MKKYYLVKYWIKPSKPNNSYKTSLMEQPSTAVSLPPSSEPNTFSIKSLPVTIEITDDDEFNADTIMSKIMNKIYEKEMFNISDIYQIEIDTIYKL